MHPPSFSVSCLDECVCISAPIHELEFGGLNLMGQVLQKRTLILKIYRAGNQRICRGGKKDAEKNR